MRPGPKNLITDVPGIAVGNASDETFQTGVTVLMGPGRMIASAHVMGGAPGTRDTELLSPDMIVEGVDALVLSGGSAYGLAAADGVTEALRSVGHGLPVAGQIVPIVPTAILFDLHTGLQDWTTGPWRVLGRQATLACKTDFEIGSVGAGTGATTANLKGGLGSASAVIDGITVGALVGVNPHGSVTVGDGPHFYAGAFEEGDEFGGLGPVMAATELPVTKVESRGGATTIAIVATDLKLTKTQAKRLAIMAHDGIARAMVPSHTAFDGDLIFAASTGVKEAENADVALVRVGHVAATCLARAIARAIHAATPAEGDIKPTWSECFG